MKTRIPTSFTGKFGALYNSQWVTLPVRCDDIVIVETGDDGKPMSTWVKGRKKATRTKLIVKETT